MTVLKAESIETERLLLLPLRVEHAEEMVTVLADPALHTFIGGVPASLAELRLRYARLVAGAPDPTVSWCNWVIRLRDEACLVGTVQATIGPSAPGMVAPGLVAEVAWVVGTAWQGRGIATEAAAGLVAWLERHAVPTVVAHIHPGHRASAAVATAVGLRPTGERYAGEDDWRRTLGR